MADLINPRRDHAAVERVGDNITESGPSHNGSNPQPAVFPAQTAIADDNFLVDTPVQPQIVQMSSSQGGRNIGTNPWADLYPVRRVTAAIYAPVNAPDEDSKKRMSELRRYVARQGWEVLDFRERRARAGTRPVFNEMMRRSPTPKFQVVIVESLDGFARSLADLCDNLSWLHRLGIRFITLHERLDLDPKTGAGQKFLDHLEILAKAESRMIVRNVRAGVARAKSLGVHCGRPLRRFPRAQACKLRREGLSISAIAARLGVPASTVADALRPPAQKPS
jgi:DNA invertase Pin-like site-specific DNA recombinase